MTIRALLTLTAIGATVMLSLLSADTTAALGLKVAPLEYKTILNQNELQKGFVDISNPSGQPISVRTSVQAFRQINNDGGLEFYTDDKVAAAIKTDLATIQLGPREAVRMYFTIDGRILPTGDVFAGLFFTTEPIRPVAGVGQLVRVGTLLSIVNVSPGPRDAEITGLNVPLVQLSDTVSGTYTVRNNGPKTTGFYPTVDVSVWPGGAPRKQESSLVFGGRERSNDFRYRSGYGVHIVSVSYGKSASHRVVISLAPWMLVLIMLVVLIASIELLLLKRRRKNRRTPTPKRKASKTTSTSDE